MKKPDRDRLLDEDMVNYFIKVWSISEVDEAIKHSKSESRDGEDSLVTKRWKYIKWRMEHKNRKPFIFR